MKGWCITNMNKNNSKKEIGILDWLKAIYEITVIIIKLYKKKNCIERTIKMTEILTSNIQIEIFMSDDKKERYILKKIWDIEKPIATIITLYPSTSDLIINDSTTTFITNNVFKCGFGGFYSVNLYSKISTGNREFGKQDTKVNDNYILKCAKISDNIIIACGSLPKTNKLVQNRLNSIIELLTKNKLRKKILFLTDSNKQDNFHPLAPKVRAKWEFM